MIRHVRRSATWSLLLLGLSGPSVAAAMCNAIPTRERTFVSEKGAVDRPYASPGREVTIALGECDGGVAFVPGATTVALTFHPPDPALAATVVLPTSSIVDMRTNELTFTFPDTRELLGTLRTGPTSIVVTVASTVVAEIGVLGSRDASCGPLKPHPIFPAFTALPPANKFHCVARRACEDVTVDPRIVRATIDADGNLLVPWDWSGVFPPGQGSDPIARLVRAGQSSLEAFPAPDPRAGRGIVIPSAAYVSSHTLTGGVLPPFLDVGPPAGDGPFPGSTLVGTVDSLEGVLRIAARVANDPTTVLFDLRTRLADGIGPIVITSPSATEERLVDLRSVRASKSVTALEEFGHGAGTAGLLLYDNRSGRLGRIPEAAGTGQLPRRVAVTDEIAAFYDVETDRMRPDLTVFAVAGLPIAGEETAADVDADALVATGLFGASGVPLAPSVGPGMVGGFAGGTRVPTLFDVDTGLTRAGRPVGGADLVEEALGIRHRLAPERFAAFGGELARLGIDTPGHVLAVGNRAVFLVCDGPCVDDDGRRRDTILQFLGADGSLRELARNPGIPFVFTGTLVGLATYEDARYGAGDSGVADLDGDGRLDGVFLTLFDVDGGRLVRPTGPNGGLVPVPADGVQFVAGDHVIVVALDEANAGPLNCDDDRSDRIVGILNGRTGRLLNTREPMTTAGFSAGRGLLTFLQPEDMQGRPLGTNFLNVIRDSDGDEVPDPYDACPLAADVDQADADVDGIGDACDAACAGSSCAAAPALRWPALPRAERRCLGRVGQAANRLVHAALEADLRCPGASSCPAASRLWRRTIGSVRTLLAPCDSATLATVGMCARTVDALVAPTPGEGCLAAATVVAVRSMATARHAGDAALAPRSCGRRLDKAMVRYAGQRHRRIARCRDELLGGRVLRHADGMALASPVECEREPKVAAALARFGRKARARIARACDAAALAELGLCGGLAAPTLDALVSHDGNGGCLVSTHQSAVDRLFALELGTTVATPEVAATAVPCPPLPSPSPTPALGPGALQVRVQAADGAGRPTDIDVGWTGLAHDLRGLVGGGFDATLACPATASLCSFAANGGAPLAAPMPVSAGGVSVCAVLALNDGLAGSFDTASGALDADIPLGLSIYNGIDIDLPCPACVTPDGVPNLGELGACAGGPRSGNTCRVDGLGHPSFGIAAGTSHDCPVVPTTLLAQAILPVEATTDTVSWATTPASPVCTGALQQQCHCPHQGGQPTKPNACIDDSATPVDGNACQPIGPEAGVCADGPFDGLCSDAPWRACLYDRDCQTGTCRTEPRKCFLDPIVRLGHSDPPANDVAHPTIVGRFCFPSAGSAAVNVVGGFPGPAAFAMPAEVRFRR